MASEKYQLIEQRKPGGGGGVVWVVLVLIVVLVGLVAFNGGANLRSHQPNRYLNAADA